MFKKGDRIRTLAELDDLNGTIVFAGATGTVVEQRSNDYVDIRLDDDPESDPVWMVAPHKLERKG